MPPSTTHTEDSGANPRRKVGRPRARPAENALPTEEAILDAARHLFRTQGFAGTSTRRIAETAGVRQPTLFHYFPSKKAIMETILRLAVQPELVFIKREAARRLPADVALYRYARFVFHNLATNPNVIGSPLQFPEAGSNEFAEFWSAYEQIYNRCRRHIAAGVRAGLFEKVVVETATEQLFALIEAPLGKPQRSKQWSAKAAEQAARLALKALLRTPERLAEVQAAAGELEATTAPSATING